MDQRAKKTGHDRDWGDIGKMVSSGDFGSHEQDALDFQYANALRAFVIAHDDLTTGAWYRLLETHQVQLLEVVAPDNAADRLDCLIAIDLIWVEVGDMPVPDGLLARLQMMVRRGDIQLVWSASGDALEQGYGALYTPSTVFLSNPSEAERIASAAIMASQPRYRLNDIGGEPDPVQIQKLTEEVNRIARLLADLSGNRIQLPERDASGSGNQVRSPSTGYAAEPPFVDPLCAGNDQNGTISVADVRNLIRVRRMRDHFFPSEIFADPAWDMLLDLIAARLAGDSVSVSSLCIAAAVPATTALRWIRTMTEAGLFVRHADPQDGRRVFIGLSDEAADGMIRYFSAVKAQSGTIF